MNKKQDIQYTIIIFVGLISVFAFGNYWFRIQNLPHNFNNTYRIFDVILFLVVSYIAWLPIIMKILLWAIASHIREITPSPIPDNNLKVAFITTIVPGSEPITMLHKTLPAIVNVRYPHDTWLLDEGNNQEVIEICRSYGVNHYSRLGKPHYNTIDNKYAAKTKGGNHNSWYDEIGNRYDFVAQIDSDFIPYDNFLLETLGYFKDPKVAFVGSPQIYGNSKHSIIVHGASQQTYNFYGPLLRGMDGMDTTLLIGANHVIRVAALKEVGHYHAHITEDLITGMKLHSKGWISKYVPKVLAIGEGPSSWKSYFNQQQRWAYGCMHILFKHSFKLFKTMTPRRMAYYFFIQQYYFSGIAMLLSLLCLGLYFYFEIQSINLELINFLLIYISVLVLLEIIEMWLQRFNISPREEKGILWAAIFINIAVWPVYMISFLGLFKNKKLSYKVTPKGNFSSKNDIQLELFIFHLVLGLFAFSCFASSFITHRDSIIMLFWSLYSSIFLLLVPSYALATALFKVKIKPSNTKFYKLNRNLYLEQSLDNNLFDNYKK